MNMTRIGSNHWCCKAVSGLLATGQLAALILLIERPAQAYVDPGSGLLTLQMLGASLAGGFYFLRHKLRRIVRGGSEADRDAEKNGSQGETRFSESTGAQAGHTER